MADLVIPPGYGLWNFYMTHATIAHTAISTMGFEVATDPYTQAANDAALAAWVTAVAPLHDAEVTYSRLVTLVGNDGPALRFESSGVGTGSRTAVVIYPPNVSYLIRKATTFAGRRYRGRMYIPFVNQAGGGQTGSLTPAELVILTARAAAIEGNLLGGVGTNAASLRLLHATSPLSPTPLPTLISDLLAQGVVATQRRRLERT